jgi:hypothetical protein
MVAFGAIVVGGLSMALFEHAKATTRDVQGTEAQIRSLEIAEAGIGRAEMEIAAGVDPDGDGCGTVRGAFDGGSYAVTASQNGQDFTLVASGRIERAQRVIEQGCRRVPSSKLTAALFAAGNITLSGQAQTDSYDSRLGSYASQAVNSDGAGTYALGEGSVGTNGSISLVGSPATVRGDAIPGPTGSVSTSGGSTVTGSQLARTQPVDLVPPTLAEFTAAWAVNDNGKWTGMPS